MTRFFSVMVAGIGAVGSFGLAAEIEVPRIHDDRMEVTLFASEPMIVHPIGTTVDSLDRLLVIESHTHFRTPEWKGPEHDQIVILEDTDSDGRADKRTVFFDQTDATMDIAAMSDGWIYLATRNEILRVKDADGDGKAEKVERRLVWLETTGDHPHNGLSGLAADGKGGFYFGMGENLGAPYVLEGSDGTSFEGGGEGGHIWHCKLDGGWLKEIATGFWNPFGVCVDTWGNVFATDNDPSSRPPCRLHHVLLGGDYGFEYRYGRSGLHPFISWNGERPGTMPMLAGTGEAPCDVVFVRQHAHEAWRGLSDPWVGSLLVASWVDHRIESYRPIPENGGFQTERQVLCEGGADFRPVALAESSDGTMFVTDWVKRNYETHGSGRVWKITAREPSQVLETNESPPPTTDIAKRASQIRTGPAPSAKDALAWLVETDPHLYHAAIQRLSREPPLCKQMASGWMPEMRQRLGLLLATRRGMKREGIPSKDMPTEFVLMVERSLTDIEPWVVIEALRWISDDRILRFQSRVEDLINRPSISADTLIAAMTTLARLTSEDGALVEKDLVQQVKKHLLQPDLDPEQRRGLLAQLPEWGGHLTADQMEPLIKQAEGETRVWMVHYLGLLKDDARNETLRNLADNSTEPPEVRLAALTHLDAAPEDAELLQTSIHSQDSLWIATALTVFSGMPLPRSALDAVQQLDDLTWHNEKARLTGEPFFSPGRPDVTDPAAWDAMLKQLDGEPDAAHGRLVFFSPKSGGCAACHRYDGLGSGIGPDLSEIHQQAEPLAILHSILQPSANVAPQYECFAITTTDGQSLTLFRMGETGGSGTYLDLAGKTVTLKIEEIAKRERLPVSIMPEGLASRLTDRELRDLAYFLSHPEPNGE